MKNEKKEENSLKQKLNDDFEVCGFSDEMQRGFCFFMGAALPVHLSKPSIRRAYGFDEDNLNAVIPKIVNSFSESSGDFSDYGDLNDLYIQQWIYNTNHIIHNTILKSEKDFDSYLRVLPIAGTIMLKEELIEDFINHHQNDKLIVSHLHNLLEDLFSNIGEHLLDKEYSNERSYEAGVAFYDLQIHFDLRGIQFLFNSIISLLSPLHKTLFNYPIINHYYPEALFANHIFSSCLQSHYGGLDGNLVKLIHVYHQFTFYEEGSINLKSSWDFEDKLLSIKTVFENALDIRRLDNYDDLREFLIELDGYSIQELKNSSITKDELFLKIQTYMEKKYDYLASDQGWSNSGDFIQYLSFLYYETALHAMLPIEILE